MNVRTACTTSLCLIGVALAGAGAPGCGPGQARMQTPAEMARLGFGEAAKSLKSPEPAVRARAAEAMGLLNDARGVQPLLAATYDPAPEVRAAAAGALGRIVNIPTLPALVRLAPVARHLKVQEGALLALTKDPRPEVRAAAAAALGRVGERWLLEPLMRLAATDPHPKVQEAAVVAIVHLEQDPNDEIPRAVGERLLERVPTADLREIGLGDFVMFVGETGCLSSQINWHALQAAGVDKATKLTVRAKDVPLGVVICRGLIACKSAKPLGFVRGAAPLTFSTIEDLAPTPRPALRLAARRSYSQTGQANAATWKGLSRKIPNSSIEEAKLGDVIEFLRQCAGVRIEVDWPTLKARERIEPDLPVWFSPFPVARKGPYPRQVPVHQALECLLSESLSGELDYLVDEGTVHISTEAVLMKRMFAPRGTGSLK